MNHLSDLELDRLLTDELSATIARGVRDHARACAPCGHRLRELTADHAAFARGPLARAPRWQRWPLALAAAAVALLVARGATPPDERAKGRAGPVLVLAAGEPGAMVRLASGDRIRAGEFLQASYSAPVDGYGAVLSRDGAGAALAYVARGDAMVALPAGHDQLFPRSTLLDRVTGAERVAVLWCEAPHPLAPLLAALAAGAALAIPTGCTARELALAKEASP